MPCTHARTLRRRLRLDPRPPPRPHLLLALVPRTTPLRAHHPRRATPRAKLPHIHTRTPSPICASRFPHLSPPQPPHPSSFLARTRHTAMAPHYAPPAFRSRTHNPAPTPPRASYPQTRHPHVRTTPLALVPTHNCPNARYSGTTAPPFHPAPPPTRIRNHHPLIYTTRVRVPPHPQPLSTPNLLRVPALFHPAMPAAHV
ncbi:hypothetical protein R3P38DRAFT_3239936 [Favolaschia claudopus]|uniref:Uncharacterized protein n=1 Tax=Favolaschia claudopus TaxID=2862362 RepID=A0AAV9Z6X8_9AGAR